MFGDADSTGKPAGDDLVEGKRTVLVALALDAAEPEAATALDRMLGTPLGDDQVAAARRIIDESGAHAQVEMVIKELADRALSALERADIDDRARVVLRDLASAATQRAV